MNLPREKMSFDLRQRYRLTARLIEAVRKKKPLRILDAGGREGYLHNFLPEDEIINLDLKYFPGDSFVVGDLLLLPFTAATFDLVVSLDVLEHIEPGRRGCFLEEIDRVSRDFLIVGGPFYAEKVAEAEKLANDFHIRATGRENEFLAEHLRLGLPRLEDLTSWIQENNFRSVALSNNYLPFWLAMMGLNAYFSVFPRAENLAAEAADLYDRLLSRYDSLTPSYRQIILIAKSGRLAEEEIRKRFPAPRLSEETRIKAWLFGEEILGLIASHTGRVRRELEEEKDRLRGKAEALEQDLRTARSELEGIKNTPAHRLYKMTWGRIRKILRSPGESQPS